MKFRQRLAWLVASGYLAGSFLSLYYLFEINDRYNQFALDHVNSAHKGDSNQKVKDNIPSLEGSRTSSWHHLADVPLGVWFVIFIVPYLQIFFMILACTRAEPKMSYAFLWPGMIYMRYQEMVGWLCHKQHTLKSMNSTVYTNGDVVLHT
ncbi:hypothetical protein FSP39_016518 [Pinctada imbricata]|uniref:Lysosomal enzyme trafficking factor n=1 Tax=Pinctada imbricata TaxID=66713 RepID=A0AA88Y0G2_PINIB|nr:hypothetical protein FSP39_016518 [Pinctada imbricata]